MDSIRVFYRKYILGIFILGLTFNYSCSVKDSLDDCPANQELLYIKVTDILTGQDITSQEDLENVTLYFFDSNKTLTRTMEVSPDQIERGIPIDVTGMNLEGSYISAWANMNDLISVPESRLGETTQEMTLMLVANTLSENFSLCPGDLFFGFQKLQFENCSECDFVKEETVIIKRKNAQLYVTVRGLQDLENIDQYYFKITTHEGGYNFEGTPIDVIQDIRETGILNDVNDFVSPEPYMMIHSDLTEEVTEENSPAIYLMKTNDTRSTDDTIIIMGKKDINGNYIKLEPGKTTNVLLEILNSGDLQVRIEVTDWDEIYQWETW